MIRDDLRFAIRGLRRDPLYAAAVVATLALTLGASTAIFSIVNGVLLRPLPYREPDRLVSVREIVPQWTKQYPTLPANARHFEEWRNRATSFAAMAALDWRTTTVSGAGEPAQATILRTSGTLFDVLQLPVAIGRPLDRSDEQPDHPRVTVISDALWGEQFSRDPAVLGRRLALGGTDYTIVGVLPPRFDVPAFDVLGDAATLRSNAAAIVPFRLNLAAIGWMGTYNYPVIGRLRGGVTIDRARAELDVLQQAIVAIARRETPDTTDLRSRMTPLDNAIVGRTRFGLVLLLGAVASVVLIACANLANLSLTRTLGRLRDAAVRSALGASRAGLVRSIVVEQIVLAAAGGALGIVVAREALLAFVKTAPIDLPRVNDVVIDQRVIGFAAAVAITAGLAVALLPAWRIGRGDLQSMLRGGGHGTTDRGGAHARGVLLSLQVALSITLLVVTGLFVASFMRLVHIDPGFATGQVVTVEIAPAAARYPDTDARAALYDRIGEGARRLPGITAISWTSALPLTGETWVDAFARIDDQRPGAQKPNANYRFVGPDYFRALSMPILQGRSLDERDRHAALVPAVISARAAQTLWPGDNPIGKPFSRGNPTAQFEVVGVVVDGHPTALDTDSPLMVYVPYWFNNEGRSVLVARTSGDAAAAIRDLRAIVRAVDPGVALGHAAPLGDLVDKAVEGRRYQASLFIAFGIVALLIATTGVYATTTYGVSRRRREMNIRVALGAPVSGVFALALRQAAVPLAIGIAAGVAGALAAGRIVAGLLFQVRPRDPVVVALAMLLVGGSGALAAAIAARQSLRINPVEALRDE
jgi:putative ABC transport system permease protein